MPEMTLDPEHDLPSPPAEQRIAGIEAEIGQRRTVTQTLFRNGKLNAMRSNEIEIRRLQIERQALREPILRKLRASREAVP